MYDSKSYWMPVRQSRFPSVDQTLEVDALIIGAGITGLTAAYLLKEEGLRVAVLEKDIVAGGQSSRTTAHLTIVTDTPLTELSRQMGESAAFAIWDSKAAAIEEIHRIIHKESLDEFFKWVPGHLHESLFNPGNLDLAAEAEMANKAGFDAEFLASAGSWAVPAVLYPRQAKLSPVAYLNALADRINSNDCRIFENTEVHSFLPSPRRGVIANGYEIRAETILHAVHVPLQGAHTAAGALVFQSKIYPHTSYVVRARLRDEMPEALYWDTEDPYNYARIDAEKGDHFVIYGGVDSKTGQERPYEDKFLELESRMRRQFRCMDVTHRWCGQVIETADGIPFIGDIGNGEFIGTGFAGNGYTFGTLTAILYRDQVVGRKNPWTDLYSPSRKYFPRGTVEYLRENIDYPYYLAKSVLSRGEKRDPSSLMPGEGAILRIDGQKVAACCDRQGRLHMVSPWCTHMGCAVKFNEQDCSWDCPCHGSRFRPDGSVIGGPAESPLASLTEDSEKVANDE